MRKLKFQSYRDLHKKFMKAFSFTGAVLCFLMLSQGAAAQAKLINILDEEIQREIQILKQQEMPVYYISYRVDETTGYNISALFGTLIYSDGSRRRSLTVTVRVGSPALDNFHLLHDDTDYAGYAEMDLPYGDEPPAVKQVLWIATHEAYQQAVSRMTKVKTHTAVKVEEEDRTVDFVLENPNVFMDPVLDPREIKFDIPAWESRLKKCTAAFLKDPAIFYGSGWAGYSITRKYFVSSQGDKIAQNTVTANAGFYGIIKTQDGMEMPLVNTYFAFRPEGLPSDKAMLNDVTNLVNNLVVLKNAPIAEPYSGPALLSGKAAAVFFHEILGHRIEGFRMKNENDAQTLKKKINELVLPATFNIYCDPQMKKFAGQDLNGYYLFDDQGTKGQKVPIVESGVLKNFLMSRTPINGFPKSNGHGRAQAGFQPVSRQSNLVVETMQPKTKEELRAELIKQTKEQNKPYGYLIEEVIGGFTQVSRFMPNAFNVTPTLVYRVYTDGRPDEVVRGVDMIGTPLSMFSQIDQAGGKSEIFNGICGAESGGVPIAAICPMLLVKIIETQKKVKSQERPFILSRPDNN